MKFKKMHLSALVWIECKDEMPNSCEVVLITDGEIIGLGFIGFDQDNKTFVRPIVLDPLHHIVAWAKIPSAPKIKCSSEYFRMGYYGN